MVFFLVESGEERVSVSCDNGRWLGEHRVGKMSIF